MVSHKFSGGTSAVLVRLIASTNLVHVPGPDRKQVPTLGMGHTMASLDSRLTEGLASLDWHLEFRQAQIGNWGRVWPVWLAISEFGKLWIGERVGARRSLDWVLGVRQGWSGKLPVAISSGLGKRWLAIPAFGTLRLASGTASLDR